MRKNNFVNSDMNFDIPRHSMSTNNLEDSNQFNEVQKMSSDVLEQKIYENMEKYFRIMMNPEPEEVINSQIYKSQDDVSDCEFYDDDTSVVRTQFSNKDEQQPTEKTFQYFSGLTGSDSQGFHENPSVFYNKEPSEFK